jgi:hypothetical protein
MGLGLWRVLVTVSLMAAGLGWGALTPYQDPYVATALSDDVDPVDSVPPPELDAPSPPGLFPRTRHVVVLVMDGARYDHTMGDDSRKYMPRIRKELLPHAAVHGSFYNTGHTITTSGHATMATGKTLMVQGEAFGKFSARTLMELAREQKGLSQESVWLIFGKSKLKDVFARSIPESPYRPSMWGQEVEDVTVADRLWYTLSTHHPVLTLVNFPSVDRRAHAGEWQPYLDAITRFDQLAADTWARIQSDPDLKDNTTLIITNDHGRRHDDWREHGDSSEGSRRVMFVAIGPDTKPGVIRGGKVRDHEDLAATVGLLLGITIPERDGDPMGELFQRTRWSLPKAAKQSLWYTLGLYDPAPPDTHVP